MQDHNVYWIELATFENTVFDFSQSTSKYPESGEETKHDPVAKQFNKFGPYHGPRVSF
jgi:hypothetical protein